MKTEILNGIQKRFYTLVAPLVMDAKIIRQNDGVAFKTSKNHTWVVATEGAKCVGFFPMVQKNYGIECNNYHASKRSPEIMKAMIEAACEYVKDSHPKISVTTQKDDYKVLDELGFKKEEEFVKCAIYTKQL